MNAGQFNRRVLIQRLESIADGAGGTVKQFWVDYITVMAMVEPASASRRLNYNQIVTEGWSHILTTWYMGIALEPNVRMRAILDNGEIMLIHSVINNSYQNKLMELACYADPMADKYTFTGDETAEFLVTEELELLTTEAGEELIT